MTVIYPSPIFGPVHSRRLGLSLGINLLPSDGKVCSFDCIYCECGLNADHRPHLKVPTREEVCTALEKKLHEMASQGQRPDVLTFAGNGEPTLHPDFPAIIDDTISLRDALCPEARISVLSNATQIHKPEVHAALLRVDNNIQKLDTVDAAFIRAVDQPQGHYDVEQVIAQLKAFNGQVIIQTMFLGWTAQASSPIAGCAEGTNTTEVYVAPWLQALSEIAPSQVMIYTIDRETPVSGLIKASPASLDAIAARVRDLGIACTVAY